MTLVAVSRAVWPIPLLSDGPLASTLGATALVMDSDTDRLAWVGKWDGATDTLAVVYFRTGNVTTGCDLDIRIETVTNGRPSGSLVAAGANADVNVADTDDQVWKTATIGTPPTMTYGQEFAILFIVDTAGATPNMNMNAVNGSLSGYWGHYPLCLQDTGAGTFANAGAPFEWIVEAGTAGVIPMPGMLPVSGGGTIAAFNSGNSPDEHALKFRVPFTCRVRGLVVAMFNMAAGSDFTFSLWPASSSGDGDALAQGTLDGDSTISTTQDGNMYLPFNTAVTLATGTDYYAGIRADTANNVGVGELATATVTNAMRGFPIPPDGTLFLATRTWTAGAAAGWVETATGTLPMISLWIDQLDNGAGGGGGGMMFIPNLEGT